ncbi:hypothetical protein MTR_0008s0460 [Medicago truncatula]|uniref:OTU domain-containing protein n=1 Tax=Medicago truncatula TaxID=3880 RepID=A0A072TL17_MEDTR|nr:hypothetical protein MTR_0008s0460 [Medicago truncatula]
MEEESRSEEMSRTLSLVLMRDCVPSQSYIFLLEMINVIWTPGCITYDGEQSQSQHTIQTKSHLSWHEFIDKVVDVAGDGHCGFRAVDRLCNMSHDDHWMICYHLQKEFIDEENERYQHFIGSDRQYKLVLGALTCSGIGSTPPDKWMIMPDLGCEVVGDDQDLYIVENLDREEKVEVEVKIEKDKNFNLNDCSADLRAN